MKSQANKWGWKALATRMLLAPVLMAGPFAVPASAQTGSKPSDAGKARAADTSKGVTTNDPKDLLKQALRDEAADAAEYAATVRGYLSHTLGWDQTGREPTDAG